MKTVLIADDSLFMRTVIKDILAGKYNVIEADSGDSCIKQFERSVPDLVLLDVVMPEGDEAGVQVLKRIMAEEPEAKVVMISALGKEDAVIKECLTLGAKDCIAKPFDEGQVRTIVEELLH